MDRTDELLDNFNNNSDSRWKFYSAYVCAVFALIWGIAYLHWKGYIDVIPILDSYVAWGGLLLLYLATWRIYHVTTRRRWWWSLIIAFIVFCLLCILVVIGIDYIKLGAAILPFKKELMRLSFVSVIYSSFSILPIEIIYNIERGSTRIRK